jgi:hypothetical protein
LYDYGARFYDPALARFHTVDPLAEQFGHQSPFVYADNNPVLFIDFLGMNAWKPEVNEYGNAYYVAEAGDNAYTLSSQFGISLSQAETITGTQGTESIAEGTVISGDRVENVTGTDVLSLDLLSKEATSQRVFDQYVFAKTYSIANPIEFTPKNEYMNMHVRASMFFQNRMAATNNSISGNSGNITGKANYKGVSVEYSLNIYSPVTSNRDVLIGSWENDINQGVDRSGRIFHTYRINTFVENGNSLGRRSWIKFYPDPQRQKIMNTLFP